MPPIQCPWRVNAGAAPSLGGIGLRLRFRAAERLQAAAMRVDGDQRREPREIAAEAAGVVHLRHETEISDRDTVAVTETAGRRMSRHQRLERKEPLADPVVHPPRDCRVVRAVLAAQPVQYPQIVDRVDVN